MKNLNALAVAFSAVALCTFGATAAPLTIVTTTTNLKSLAEAVGGDKVQVRSIATGQEDPHFIDAKPSYMMAAHKADLWIRVGLELEVGYESPILDGARNAKIAIGQPGHLDASQGVLVLEVPTKRVTREMGDVHPMGNPHYWLDPLNGRIMAKTIADRLAELDPADAEVFKSNLAAFQKALDERMFGKELTQQVGGDRLWGLEARGQLDAFLKEQGLSKKLGGWAGRMAQFRGEKVVTFHRSWVYLLSRFGLEVADELEPKPGVPPSPGHVLEVIEKIKALKIHALLMEPFYSRKAPDLIAQKTGIKVVECANAVNGQTEAKDYLSMIDNIIERLAAALSAGEAGR